MTSDCYVLAYINPDTDGVSSSIGYSYLKCVTTGEEYVPVVFGAMNSETVFVLNHFGIDAPVVNPEIPENAKLVVVDTHHVNQLPDHLNFSSVVEILDHHPAGNPTAFPNAAIQNEKVGAVATLVAERLRGSVSDVDSCIAGLLIAGILSNTLGFSAPSTSVRDKQAMDWLSQFAPVESEFADRMFESRAGAEQESTNELLLADYKEFEIASQRFGISQIESANLRGILERTDLLTGLLEIKRMRDIDHVFLNAIDIKGGSSTIVCPQAETQNLLKSAIGANFNEGFAAYDRILLRKTDLVPQLQDQNAQVEKR